MRLGPATAVLAAFLGLAGAEAQECETPGDLTLLYEVEQLPNCTDCSACDGFFSPTELRPVIFEFGDLPLKDCCTASEDGTCIAEFDLRATANASAPLLIQGNCFSGTVTTKSPTAVPTNPTLSPTKSPTQSPTLDDSSAVDLDRISPLIALLAAGLSLI
eukprot:CAMPEP_0184511912 /NCGR_PEP_ID=MMETSP0198_2-20121128/2600_1 /TAXON_ID=1112570 /ORGANISM="Thraustochytrium sp., Strain LLF1b" /LENGTH=159 /DNA_ID=CAMNT_0026901901 /DNA_START=158 /DNA_END=637 /DNA_ORIENTATION=+